MMNKVLRKPDVKVKTITRPSYYFHLDCMTSRSYLPRPQTASAVLLGLGSFRSPGQQRTSHKHGPWLGTAAVRTVTIQPKYTASLQQTPPNGGHQHASSGPAYHSPRPALNTRPDTHTQDIPPAWPCALSVVRMYANHSAPIHRFVVVRANQNLPAVHTILGKKANRSSSLSHVVNYFDSSPSLSDASVAVLDSPFRKAEYTPKQRASFYNPRRSSDSSESDSDDDDNFARDESPDVHEGDNGIRARPRSSKGYIAPKRWPERLKGSDSSGVSSGMGTAASNSTTSLTEIPPGSMGRQSSPEIMCLNVVRGSISDIGSEDLPLRKLSVSRDIALDSRNLSPFVPRYGYPRL
jgi:hypothetical protein